MSVDILGSISIGIVVTVVSSLILWQVKEKRKEKVDKKVVRNWLYEKTKQHKNLTMGSPINDLRWVPTIEIAAGTNLSPDRVRYVCSIHKEIRPMMKKDIWPGQSLEEKWAIREFVDKGLRLRKAGD